LHVIEAFHLPHDCIVFVWLAFQPRSCPAFLSAFVRTDTKTVYNVMEDPSGWRLSEPGDSYEKRLKRCKQTKPFQKWYNEPLEVNYV